MFFTSLILSYLCDRFFILKKHLEEERKLKIAFDEAEEPWKHDKTFQQAEISIRIAIHNKMEAERIQYKKCY